MKTNFIEVRLWGDQDYTLVMISKIIWVKWADKERRGAGGIIKISDHDETLKTRESYNEIKTLITGQSGQIRYQNEIRLIRN